MNINIGNIKDYFEPPVVLDDGKDDLDLMECPITQLEDI